MLTRNDQPIGFALNFAIENNFDFATESIFTNSIGNASGIIGNEFLLMDTEPMLLMDSSNLLTMGS